MNETEIATIEQYAGGMKQIYNLMPTDERGCLKFLIDKLDAHLVTGGVQNDETTKRIFQQFFRLHMQYVAHRDNRAFPTLIILKLSPEQLYKKAMVLYEELKASA